VPKGGKKKDGRKKRNVGSKNACLGEKRVGGCDAALWATGEKRRCGGKISWDESSLKKRTKRKQGERSRRKKNSRARGQCGFFFTRVDV